MHSRSTATGYGQPADPCAKPVCYALGMNKQKARVPIGELQDATRAAMEPWRRPSASDALRCILRRAADVTGVERARTRARRAATSDTDGGGCGAGPTAGAEAIRSGACQTAGASGSLDSPAAGPRTQRCVRSRAAFWHALASRAACERCANTLFVAGLRVRVHHLRRVYAATVLERARTAAALWPAASGAMVAST
ncbi:hypothetical protein PSPO01_11345 [Paraphaeosphaeria sporulosa]